MEAKDWLNDDGFFYVGRVLAKPPRFTYQYTYSNEKLKAIDAYVALWTVISDNMCVDVYYRISSGEVSGRYIGFWNKFTTTPVHIENTTPLDLGVLPVDSLSVATVKNAIESVLQLFCAVAVSYKKDSERYGFDTCRFPIFAIASVSIAMTDKTPLDWFTLPDGAELEDNIARLIHCKDMIRTQDSSDACAVLENAIQMKQARAAVLKNSFGRDSIRECMETASKFLDSSAAYKLYIPVMQKFFKDETFFSENYIDYSSDIA